MAKNVRSDISRRLLILSRAASELLVSDSPELVVQSLAEQVMNQLDCQFFFNYLDVLPRRCLRLNAYAGIPAETAKAIEVLEYGTAVCGTVAMSGKRIIKECVQDSDEAVVSLVKSFGVNAYACHPMLSPTGNILGTLSFGTKTRERFKEDELELMKTMANQIAVALQRRQAERDLRQLNEELEARVAERTRQLEDTYAELKSYTNIVAHDFRTPMVNLKGFSGELGSALSQLEDILADDAVQMPPHLQERIQGLLSRDMAESLAYIGTSVDKLDRMVSALLKLSRIGRIERVGTVVDVNSIVQSVVSIYKRAIAEKKIRLEIMELPKIKADPLALEQTFGNLIDNAVKYLEPSRQGFIRIDATESESEYIFCVRDNGRGIAVEDHEKIFELFRRAGNHDMPGEGMGLAYVRTVLRQLGGRVWCESELGSGTTICFAVPKRN